MEWLQTLLDSSTAPALMAFSFGIAYGDFALPIGYEYRCYRIYR